VQLHAFAALPKDKGSRYPLNSTAGFVGSRTSLDDVEKRKFVILLGLLEPVASYYTDYNTPAPLM
jgi:hypothetical protein